MLSKQKASAILEKMVPHALHEDSPIPITPNHFHLTEYDLNAMGIGRDELDGHDWYDGWETHHKGRVCVIEKDKLEAYIAGNGFDNAVTQVGSVITPDAIKPMEISEIIDIMHSLLKNDIDGVRPITPKAREACSQVMRMLYMADLERKAERGRG